MSINNIQNTSQNNLEQIKEEVKRKLELKEALGLNGSIKEEDEINDEKNRENELIINNDLEYKTYSFRGQVAKEKFFLGRNLDIIT